MPDPKRATQEMLLAMSLSPSPIDRLLTPGLLLLAALAAALRLLAGDWPNALYTIFCAALLFGLAAFPASSERLLGTTFSRRHAFVIVLLWLYGTAGIAIVRALSSAPATGKDSAAFYGLLLTAIAVQFIIDGLADAGFAMRKP